MQQLTSMRSSFGPEPSFFKSARAERHRASSFVSRGREETSRHRDIETSIIDLSVVVVVVVSRALATPVKCGDRPIDSIDRSTRSSRALHAPAMTFHPSRRVRKVRPRLNLDRDGARALAARGRRRRRACDCFFLGRGKTDVDYGFSMERVVPHARTLL